jgi:glycosyltransferase involved in cell wall biosynthesis
MRRIRGAARLLRLAAEAGLFVALSRDGAAEAASLGVPAERITIIPNAVLTAGGPRASSGGDGTIVFVGAMREQKGLDCLLDSFARLPATERLALVGDGPERGRLERRARELGIGGRVHFVGQVEDPSPYLRRARLFVLPSWAEGMSNALLEAMAFALPVVATRVGGNVDLIQDGVTGLLVEPGQPEQLAAAMARLLADEGFARTLGCNARGAVLGQPSMEVTVNRYLEVYGSLLAAGRP